MTPTAAATGGGGGRRDSTGDSKPATPGGAHGVGRRRRACRWAPHELAAFASLACLISLFFYILKRVVEGPEGQRWIADRYANDVPVPEVVDSPAIPQQPAKHSAILVRR